ncbi:hypothetical protein DES41_113108 [Pseudorhodoferax soli]|uniref:Uncharacterized protein n=1 Tax=Pseudorhodoferax soli TaxID=545864 RepID=A0A368XGP3_9BURK|nr:hypothetical protein DES41_113108 [Pseudorhodoferax soli]
MPSTIVGVGLGILVRHIVQLSERIEKLEAK